jgi:hypothetical protein
MDIATLLHLANNFFKYRRHCSVMFHTLNASWLHILLWWFIDLSFLGSPYTKWNDQCIHENHSKDLISFSSCQQFCFSCIPYFKPQTRSLV